MSIQIRFICDRSADCRCVSPVPGVNQRPWYILLILLLIHITLVDRCGLYEPPHAFLPSVYVFSSFLAFSTSIYSSAQYFCLSFHSNLPVAWMYSRVCFISFISPSNLAVRIFPVPASFLSFFLCSL